MPRNRFNLNALLADNTQGNNDAITAIRNLLQPAAQPAPVVNTHLNHKNHNTTLPPIYSSCNQFISDLIATFCRLQLSPSRSSLPLRQPLCYSDRTRIIEGLKLESHFIVTGVPGPGSGPALASPAINLYLISLLPFADYS